MAITKWHYKKYNWRNSFLENLYFCSNIPKLVPSWTDPVVIGRHAFGDQYRATDFKVPGKGKMEVKWTSENGKDEIKYEVF